MNEEDVLDQLIELNSTLDVLIRNLKILEQNNPQSSSYFAQLLKSLKKPVKTSCGDTGVETPAISCEGATNSVKWVMAVRDEVPIPEEPLVVIIDGMESREPPQWYDTRFLVQENFPILIPENFYVESAFLVSNLDMVNHRFEFKSTSNDVLIFMFDNPTVVEFDNTHQHVGVCLAASTSQIGCVGATSSCELQNDSDYVAIDNMSLKIDGVLYTADDDFPPILRVAPERRVLRASSGSGYSWQYYLVLENKSDQLIRIEFLNYQGHGSGVGNQNPTLELNLTAQTGTVCLAPKTLCLPTTVQSNSINAVEFTGVQTLFYRINQDSVQSVSQTFESPGGIDWMMQLINQQENMRVFTFGGGGEAYFHFFNGLFGGVGDGEDPMTITLFDLNGGQVVQSVFGMPLVELHACGLENFPGV